MGKKKAAATQRSEELEGTAETIAKDMTPDERKRIRLQQQIEALFERIGEAGEDIVEDFNTFDVRDAIRAVERHLFDVRTLAGKLEDIEVKITLRDWRKLGKPAAFDGLAHRRTKRA